MVSGVEDGNKSLNMRGNCFYLVISKSAQERGRQYKIYETLVSFEMATAILSLI
ncbi:hypothetical protein SAMN04488511_11517 [Pedobacter suwonensis]|uniref:Uncharacterized protein n=1 Tax=Pedobacter suwonensis TaxID=332999 RepID=A0A1I0TV13_9SPHI|nr:hypothetical protein SAMN04488511_11517 [Pedobacter suwonensis]